MHNPFLYEKPIPGQQRLYRKDAHRLRLMEIIPVSDPLSKIPHTSKGSIMRAGMGRGNEE